MTFLDVWIGYTLFGTAVLCAMFIWAVRARQFSDLERGGHIPLAGADPIKEPKPDRRPARIDRYTWVALALLTIAAVTAALVVGLRG